MRVNSGTDHQSRVMFDTASNGTGVYAASNYIALTENSTAPSAGNTSLAGELTDSGLTRTQGTYAHTNGTNTTNITKTFTSGAGVPRQINKAGLFNAPSTGTLSFETPVPSPPTLVGGDQVAVNWLFNF